MDVPLLKPRASERELLTRAEEIYRWKNLRDGDPGEVITDSLETYQKLFLTRYGSEEDALSQGVVYGSRQKRPSPGDLDEVARRLVNRGGPNKNGNGRSGTRDSRIARTPPSRGLPDQSHGESDLLARAMIIYQRKNRRGCGPKEVVKETLETYIKLYELLSTPQDELSRGAVHGPESGDIPAPDLDDVARRLALVGRCYRRGDCCRRTIGVHVSERDILRIEETGRSREEFINEDGRLKAGPGGCSFFVAGPDGSPHCQIYTNRPEACRNFFCNRGPVLRTPVPPPMHHVHNGTRSNGNKTRSTDA